MDKIQCDRCGRIVEELRDDNTAGFYDVSDGYWARFARWEERAVCDECMHSDPRYKQVYDPNTR